tara:strand:- start:1027 stop:2136 length:1110 start_codon:yes stop_codon:yes gene_type:complete
MKRNSSKRAILKNRDNHRWQRRLTSKEKRKKLNRRKSFRPTHSTHTRIPRASITAPHIIDIEKAEYRDKTLGFIADINNAIFVSGKKIRIRFNSTKLVVATAGTLLLAEVDRIVKEKGPDWIKCTYPKNQKIEIALQQSGFFKIINMPERLALRNTAPEKGFIRFIPICSGTEVDGSLTKPFFDEFRGHLNASCQSFLYGAIIEAIGNVHYHAYIMSRENSTCCLNHTWWMHTGIDHTGALFIMICDLGAGIPQTMPKKLGAQFIGIFKSVIGSDNLNDANIIKVATELSQTRTKKSYRGKGFKNMHDAIDIIGKGSLRVMSNKGCYSYKPNGTESTVNYSNSINGTMIVWSIPIKELSTYSRSNSLGY